MGIKSGNGRERTFAQDSLQLAAIGMEAEFSVFVDNEQVKPEDVFHDPRTFLGRNLMHRRGTSYQRGPRRLTKRSSPVGKQAKAFGHKPAIRKNSANLTRGRQLFTREL